MNFPRDLFEEILAVPFYKQYIDPEYMYNLISSGYLEIDEMLSKLEKEELIGDNPGRFL